MYNKRTIAYITLSPVFAITLSSASLSFAADGTFTSQTQNMKGLILAYADLAFDKIDTNRDGSVDKNEADSYVSKSEPKTKTSPNYSTSHGEMKK
jgi:hypothetical protein